MGYFFDVNMDELIAEARKAGVLNVEGKLRAQATIAKATIAVQAIARAEAPSRTGKLRASIMYKVEPLRGIVYPTANYAVYIEKGRGTVVPVNKKVLASKFNPGWGSKNAAGYYIIGKKSKAVPANPFIKRASDKAKPLVRGLFTVMYNDIKKEM